MILPNTGSLVTMHPPTQMYVSHLHYVGCYSRSPFSTRRFGTIILVLGPVLKHRASATHCKVTKEKKTAIS